ncbi:methyl-accepting chemotaxis protein [Parasulfitobacter algicola]|uniref:Methyl-accepting chemotaxis protein n=1 Tax=Parasulfitobacter algicola TaxID=2614809 RepID=A0ABX2IRI7_9RHOB|nr:methyl-accepting chemotaxis protein [Sulfitobacter algicola]NSX54950.1 methyl-accepting chemotaxis protein [Sulfitobacter algicola]
MIDKILAAFGSMATKFGIVLLILGGAAGTGFYISYSVFETTVSNLSQLEQNKLPQLRRNNELRNATDDLKTDMTSMLLATQQGKLATIYGLAEERLDQIAVMVRDFDVDVSSELEPMVASVDQSLGILFTSRAQEFESIAEIHASLDLLSKNAEAIRGQIIELGDTAYFDLVIGGEKTVLEVADTVEKIVEKDMYLAQLALHARADVNLLGGVSLALSGTDDPALISILQDLADGALHNVDEVIPELLSNADVELDQEAIEAKIQVFRDLLDSDLSTAILRRDDILSARQGIDKTMATLVDDLVFSLTINSSDGIEKNSETIQSLMDNEVTAIRAMGELDAALNGFLAAGLNVAVADDVATLNIAQQNFLESANKLQTAALSAPEALREHVTTLAEIAAPEIGLGSIRVDVLTARENTITASQKAAEKVAEIGNIVSKNGYTALIEIEKSADTIITQATTAKSRIFVIVVVGFVGFIIAISVTYFLILVPMNRICRTTERLASGDLAPVTGFSQRAGEISRLATALQVFRDGLVEKEQLQVEEVKRKETAEYERKITEAEEKRREEAERQRQLDQEEADRALQAKADAERRALRHIADEERKQRMAEQEVVMQALAEGLGKLSNGDLDAEIKQDFPESYLKLKSDFNAAIANLSDVIARISNSGEIIHGSTAEISSSAVDLSRRTEHSAATLEETAAAMDLLTESVKSSSEGAEKAYSVVTDAKDRANNGREVVSATVEVMSQIAESSEKIKTITKVIDEIAFQTNLLALNAGVEAARAGDAGRGFAVVASEVRGLAQRSSDAAKEISTLIAESSDHVGRGVDMVGKTGDALEAITTSVSETTEQVTEIATSAKKQATRIQEINTALADLDHVTQQNTAMFEETTAAAATLSQETNSLAQALSIFNIAKQHDAANFGNDTTIMDISEVSEEGRTQLSA